jgi:hypothetical protein
MFGAADVARGFQHIANSTQDILAQHQANVLNHYFDPETGEPYTKTIFMPDGRIIEIPLIALVPPSMLRMERMKVKMALQVRAGKTKRHKYDGKVGAVDRSSFRVSFTSQANGNGHGNKNRNCMEVEMEFVATDPPDLSLRIQEWFSEVVHPVLPTPADPDTLPGTGPEFDPDSAPDEPPTPMPPHTTALEPNTEAFIEGDDSVSSDGDNPPDPQKSP